MWVPFYFSIGYVALVDISLICLFLLIQQCSRNNLLLSILCQELF